MYVPDGVFLLLLTSSLLSQLFEPPFHFYVSFACVSQLQFLLLVSLPQPVLLLQIVSKLLSRIFSLFSISLSSFCSSHISTLVTTSTISWVISVTCSLLEAVVSLGDLSSFVCSRPFCDVYSFIHRDFQYAFVSIAFYL
ncbi:hypothetical protein AMTRI_Chr03g48770 [Amborella trichopoda]